MKFDKKVVMYHGLGGCPAGSTKRVLNRHGLGVLFEYFDFAKEWFKDHGKSMFEKELKKIERTDLIIGNSYGGYLAYQLSKATGKDLILINPALDRDKSTTGLGWFDIPYYNEKSRIELFLGEYDITVRKEYTLDYLNGRNDEFTAYILKNTDHGISNQHINMMLSNSYIIKSYKESEKEKV